MVAQRFVRIFSIAALVTLLISLAESNVSCPPSAKDVNTGTKGKYIVMLKSSNDASDHLETMQTCWNKRVERVTSNSSVKSSSLKDENVLHDFSVKGTALKGYSGIFTDSFVKNVLSKMQNVQMVEKDAPVKINYAIPQRLNKRAVDTDPPKNLDRIDQAKRPLDGKFIFPDSAGQGVNIFVVDTGIRTTHNEFGGRASFGAAFCDGCNNQDENGHGTQVASVAAGKTFGVARNANLIAVRVLDANGSGSNAVVINGMSFVLQQHQNGKNKNSVVNMSLGGSQSDAVNQAVQSLTDAGVHVAVAAGNDGADACNSSPSSAPTAIAVGATDEDSEQIASFSNVGKCVNIFAPGTNIIGAGIQSDSDTAILTGTSQATPHVAGTLALIIAKSGNASPDNMKSQLDNLSTSGVVQGIGNTGSPDSFLRTPSP